MKNSDLNPPPSRLGGHFGIESRTLINIFSPLSPESRLFSETQRTIRESRINSDIEDARMFRKLEERGIPPFIPEREILEQF